MAIAVNYILFIIYLLFICLILLLFIDVIVRGHVPHKR